jgi:chemotaxis protein methyltransferase CheR
VSIAAAGHSLLLDPDYSSLKQHLIDSTGLAYYADKDADLAARISARLSQLSLNSCRAYLELLKDPQAGESERHLLIGQLTIGETYFFRHVEQFDGLREVVFPDLIERNRERRTLRVWSAGCAIGAEVYSLAILLKEHFADRLAGWNVQIIGTDINQAFLARAARGEFDERALRSTPDEVRRQWFSQTGATWTIRPFIREAVTFQHHNLVEHPYPSIVHGIAALDLILCRNVLIYFDWPVIARIIGRFHDCLVEGGWLAVGHAESNPEVFKSFRTVNIPGATLYQKSGEGRTDDVSFPAPAPEAAWRAWSPTPLPWSPPVLPSIPESPPVGLPQNPLKPARSGAVLVRGLADEGKWLEAARECERLLVETPLDPIAYFYQALILEQLKQYADAEQSYRRAIYLDRGFVLAHYHLALLLGRTSRIPAATQSLRTVERLLASLNKSQPIPDADGLTAGNLGELVDMHVELWSK